MIPFFHFIAQLLILGLLLLVLAGVLAPFESLGWWAGWFGQPADQCKPAAPAEETPGRPPPAEAEHYLVYLSGVGVTSGDYLDKKESSFLERLSACLPGATVVKDVFPYAMNNRGLTGQRLFAWMWRWIQRRKFRNETLLSSLVNLRNVFQVAVSADRRYGPIYNYGIAEVILGELRRLGYRVSSGKPVTLIGSSGGGQIALGAATYLKTMLGEAPLYVISIGGVLSDDPGLEHVEHLYHLYGTKDFVHKVGVILYAGRWPVFPRSIWNQAKAQGRIELIAVGPFKHTGRRGYLDPVSHLENGQSHLERTVDTVVRLILAYYTHGNDDEFFYTYPFESSGPIASLCSHWWANDH